MNTFLTKAMEKGQLPDPLIRFGIRRLCQDRLREISDRDLDLRLKRRREYLSMLLLPLATL